MAAACISRRPPPEGADGATIFEYQGCAQCHGDEGGGRWLGPKLEDLAARGWTRETLAAFVAEPDPFCERDERLDKLRGRYMAAMPAYGETLSEEQRDVLAAWLLERWP